MKPTPSHTPLPRLATLPTLKSGQVTAKTSIVLKTRGGDEEPKHEHSFENVFPASGPALAGICFGLTLPGPDKSYLMARIDGICYLPCEASEAGVRGAMAKSSELVQEQLEKEVKEVRAFFAEYRR